MVLSDWQLGYDLFETFTDLYETMFYEDKVDKDRLLDSYIELVQKIEKWKERKMKNDPDIKPVPSILCNVCKHRIDYNTCKAFSDGIPKELHNELHYTKHSSQKNDIVFELGEEGSKNAGIKQLEDVKLAHRRFTEEYLERSGKIIIGEIEEEYIEK
jgi:uncharacterized protein YlaI